MEYDAPYTSIRRFGFWFGLTLFALLLCAPAPESMRAVAREHFAAIDPHAQDARAQQMMTAAAVTALVACWWIFVAVPIPVASLLPLVLFPLLGVMPVSIAASRYADSNVFLFMGGFIIALGLQRWGLHRRIALRIVALIGAGRASIVLGFMVASAFLSMWISNTATTMVMLPIGMSVVTALAELDRGAAERDRANFAAALMLGIAYAASIGGVATPIGTPPNIAFAGQYRALVSQHAEISFLRWTAMFAPLVLLFIPVAWLLLVGVTCRFQRGRTPGGRAAIREELRKLGPLQRPERAMTAVFAATGLLWMTRVIPLDEHTQLGWAPLLEQFLRHVTGGLSAFRAAYVDDATVALAMAVLLFIIPADRDNAGRRRMLMDWSTAVRLPWGILLLFGGGFAIAAGFEHSGLSHWCGYAFAGLSLHDPFALVIGVCLVMTFLTEITSNTATTQVMLPIIAKVGAAAGVNPLLLMLPATLSASCAFMLPVATPPNAIVFSSGHVTMGQMVRSGLLLNLVGVVLITVIVYGLVRPVMGL